MTIEHTDGRVIFKGLNQCPVRTRLRHSAGHEVCGGYGSKGCLGDDSFPVVEKWHSIAALLAHAASPSVAFYTTP